MDSMENRLREDAAKLCAAAPAHVNMRIQNALRREQGAARHSGFRFLLKPPLVAGAAGALVAVVAGILWLGQSGQPRIGPDSAAMPATMAGYRGTVLRLADVMDQRMSDELVLEQELNHLSTDLRRIQSRVRDQLDPLL